MGKKIRKNSAREIRAEAEAELGGKEGGRSTRKKASAARGYVREGAWLRAASNQLSAARTSSSVSSVMKSKNLGAENSYASSIPAAAATVPVSSAMDGRGILRLGLGGSDA